MTSIRQCSHLPSTQIYPQNDTTQSGGKCDTYQTWHCLYPLTAVDREDVLHAMHFHSGIHGWTKWAIHRYPIREPPCHSIFPGILHIDCCKSSTNSRRSLQC